MQRLARSGIDADLFQLQAFHFRERLHQIVREPVGITTALRNDGGCCLARRSRGAERVFVRVNPDRVLWKTEHAGVSEHRFGHNAKRHRSGCSGGQAEKRTAGCERKAELVIVGHRSPRWRNLTAKSMSFLRGTSCLATLVPSGQPCVLLERWSGPCALGARAGWQEYLYEEDRVRSRVFRNPIRRALFHPNGR